MSTPSRIILKLKKVDCGKKNLFDKEKLPIAFVEWDNMFKKGNLCQEVTLNGEYIAIYCHWDGDSVGEVLKSKFKTYDDVLNLILGGDCSCIESDGVRHYANRTENTKWEDIKPRQGDLEYVRSQIYGRYEYIFKNGKWSTN